MIKTKYVTRGTIPSLVVTNFNQMRFSLDDSDKQKLSPVPDKVAEEYKKKGWNDGSILSCFSYDEPQVGVLRLNCESSSFFRTMYYSDSRVVAVNAVMDFGDHTLLIKRPEDVYGYPGWYDCPAGLVPFRAEISPIDMMGDRLEDRIKKDTNLPLESMEVRKMHPIAIDSGSNAFCFFYLTKCDLSMKEIESNFEELGNEKPYLIKKSELSDFLEKHDVVFPEVFEYAFPKEFQK